MGYKEKLERIKQYYSAIDSMEPDLQKDLSWLIKQAERSEKNAHYLHDMDRQLISEQKHVEELEYQIEIDSIHTNNIEKLAKKYADENQRYKEEIESHAPDGRNHTNAQYVGLLNQRTHYRNSLGYVRNEIYSALYSGKSEDVKNHYLINALREANESLQVEPDSFAVGDIEY